MSPLGAFLNFQTSTIPKLHFLDSLTCATKMCGRLPSTNLPEKKGELMKSHRCNRFRQRKSHKERICFLPLLEKMFSANFSGGFNCSIVLMATTPAGRGTVLKGSVFYYVWSGGGLHRISLYHFHSCLTCNLMLRHPPPHPL